MRVVVGVCACHGEGARVITEAQMGRNAMRRAAVLGAAAVAGLVVGARVQAAGCPQGSVLADVGTPGSPVMLCVGRTEVTVEAYGSCVLQGGCVAPAEKSQQLRGNAAPLMRCNASAAEAGASSGPDHPVTCVTALQAEAFCAFHGARLPTETEWDRVAHGSAAPVRRFPWGDESPGPTRLNACGPECAGFARPAPGTRPLRALHDATDGFAFTAPVGSHPAGATPEGALDLAGNVREWTASPWVRTPGATPARDEKRRVVRGSGYLSSDAARAGAAARLPLGPEVALATVGFRCVKDLR